MKECTFQPATFTDKTKSIEPSEVVNRLYAQRKPQIEKTNKTKEDIEYQKMQEECTFAPQINNKRQSKAMTSIPEQEARYKASDT